MYISDDTTELLADSRVHSHKFLHPADLGTSCMSRNYRSIINRGHSSHIYEGSCFVERLKKPIYSQTRHIVQLHNSLYVTWGAYTGIWLWERDMLPVYPSPPPISASTWILNFNHNKFVSSVLSCIISEGKKNAFIFYITCTCESLLAWRLRTY